MKERRLTRAIHKSSPPQTTAGALRHSEGTDLRLTWNRATKDEVIKIKAIEIYRRHKLPGFEVSPAITESFRVPSRLLEEKKSVFLNRSLLA